jgi:predicted transcriptional regulator
MKQNIKIEIKNEKESAHDFINAWHMAEKGKSPKAPINRICFQNLETLLSTLTPRRLDLLRVMHDTGDISIRALAANLKRDYKNVYQDIKILENIGLAVKTGRLFSVPWESIVAEFKLAA